MLASFEVALNSYNQKQAVFDNTKLAKSNSQLQKLFEVLDKILLNADCSMNEIQLLLSRIATRRESISDEELFQGLPMLEYCAGDSDVDFSRELLQPLFDVQKDDLFSVYTFCQNYAESGNIDLSIVHEALAEISDLDYLASPRRSLAKGLHQQSCLLAIFESFGFQSGHC